MHPTPISPGLSILVNKVMELGEESAHCHWLIKLVLSFVLHRNVFFTYPVFHFADWTFQQDLTRFPGKTIFQTSLAVDENDTPASLAEKIHALEHQHFPAQIEKWIQQH